MLSVRRAATHDVVVLPINSVSIAVSNMPQRYKNIWDHTVLLVTRQR